MGGLRKLGVLTLGMGLVCCGILTAGCGGGADPPETRRAPTQPRSRPSRARGTEAPIPTVDLTELLTEVPEYQGRGRNLFAYGQERRVVEAPSQAPSTPTATTTVPPATPRSAQQRPPARIDLKFAGFVEKTGPSGVNKKYAVFLNGEEILTGAEGDLVGNRYKVIEIGLESVTVGVEGSQVTQKIPLRTN